MKPESMLLMKGATEKTVHRRNRRSGLVRRREDGHGGQGLWHTPEHSLYRQSGRKGWGQEGSDQMWERGRIRDTPKLYPRGSTGTAGITL